MTTTLTTGFEALDGLFFAITPNPDFGDAADGDHVTGSVSKVATGEQWVDNVSEDMPMLLLRHRWSF